MGSKQLTLSGLLLCVVQEDASDDETGPVRAQPPPRVCALRGVLCRRHHHHRVSALV